VFAVLSSPYTHNECQLAVLCIVCGSPRVITTLFHVALSPHLSRTLLLLSSNPFLVPLIIPGPTLRHTRFTFPASCNPESFTAVICLCSLTTSMLIMCVRCACSVSASVGCNCTLCDYFLHTGDSDVFWTGVPQFDAYELPVTTVELCVPSLDFLVALAHVLRPTNLVNTFHPPTQTYTYTCPLHILQILQP
jgi:hypothetical protein